MQFDEVAKRRIAIANLGQQTIIIDPDTGRGEMVVVDPATGGSSMGTGSVSVDISNTIIRSLKLLGISTVRHNIDCDYDSSCDFYVQKGHRGDDKYEAEINGKIFLTYRAIVKLYNAGVPSPALDALTGCKKGDRDVFINGIGEKGLSQLPQQAER